MALFNWIKGLGRTRKIFLSGIANLFVSNGKWDEAFMEELESQLLLADIGVDLSVETVDLLKENIKKDKLNDPNDIFPF